MKATINKKAYNCKKLKKGALSCKPAKKAGKKASKAKRPCGGRGKTKAGKCRKARKSSKR